MQDAWLMLALGIFGSELVLTHLIGVCPLLAVARKFETAAGLACALILVQPIALGLFSLFKVFLPVQLTTANVSLPLIALCNLAAVQIIVVLGLKINHNIFSLSRPFMALLNINCVLLGITLLTLEANGGILYGLAIALGYGFALIVVAEISARLEGAATPAFMRGAPIMLLSLGIISLAITGVQG